MDDRYILEQLGTITRLESAVKTLKDNKDKAYLLGEPEGLIEALGREIEVVEDKLVALKKEFDYCGEVIRRYGYDFHVLLKKTFSVGRETVVEDVPRDLIF